MKLNNFKKSFLNISTINNITMHITYLMVEEITPLKYVLSGSEIKWLSEERSRSDSYKITYLNILVQYR